ncbi:hypothetical protein CRSA5733_12790 [Cronobacter sakazakii]
MRNGIDFTFYLPIINGLLQSKNNLSTKFDYVCCNDIY